MKIVIKEIQETLGTISLKRKVCECVCACECVCVWVSICVCACVSVCMCAYVCMHVQNH